MRRIVLASLLLCFFAVAARGQGGFTTVTGTVTDPNGVKWACATISAQLVTAGGGAPTLNGGGFTTQTSPVALGCPTSPGTGASGSFVMRLADSGVIVPSNTTWRFTVNTTGNAPPLGTGPQSFTFTTAINCSTNTPATCTSNQMDISSSLSALAPALGGGGGGLNFNGVPTGVCTNGTTAFNTITGDIYTCKNGVWTLNLYSATAGSFYPGITMFGTSLTNPCNGASSAVTCYAQLLANDVGGGVFKNWARNGDQVADTARLWVFPQALPQLTGNAQYTVEIGVNDANFTGNANAYNTADKQANYTNILNAALSWLAIPQSNITKGANCTQTSGVWALDSATFAPNNGLIQSTTNGSVLTCSFTSTGNTIYLWYRMIDGDGGTASVTLDGGAAGTINGFGQNNALIATANATTDSVGVLKITNTPGAHSVAITVTSTTNAANVISIIGIGSAAALTEYNLPTVYVMGVIKEQTDQNSAATVLFNGFNSTAVTALANDGLNVRFVDARSYINPSSDYTDQLHPNDAGNAHLRDAFEFAMRPSGLASGFGTGVNTSNYTSLYDSFVRANGALGAPNWTGAVGLTVSGNTVVGSTGGTYNASGKPGSGNNASGYVNGWNNSQTGITGPYVIGRDQFSRVRVAVSPVGANPIFVRVLDNPPIPATGAFYQYDCSATARRILRNTSTVLVSNASACVAGDVIEVQIKGNVITGYINGVQDLSVTDILGAPVGFPSVGVFGNGVGAFNNWSGGSLVPIANLNMQQDWLAPQNFNTIGARPGVKATLTGTGACATFGAQTGGAWVGQSSCASATAASTLTITPGPTALNGWLCYVQDETTRANLFQQTAHTTTSCTLTATSVTQNDVFVFSAVAY